MDFSQFQTIFWSALGTIITALVAWLTSVIINWFNEKIKDKKMKQHAQALTVITMNAVESVMQSFVSTMKKADKWNEDVAAEAKKKAETIIKTQLTEELVCYIKENFGDVEEFISNKIESIIYQIKK